MIKTAHYEINAKNLAFHELNGLRVKVIESTDKEKNGIDGEVIGETKNTLIVLVNGKEKVLPKNECVFEFILGKEKVKLNGKIICKRAEDRVKDWRNNNG